MDCFDKRYIALITGMAFLSMDTASYAKAGYFQLHNLMSAAQKNIPNNFLLNDNTLNLEAQEKSSGHVVNTQFSNNGGMAGCGISSTLMTYMYQNRGTADLSSNYMALNVYSQVMGFDPQAPFWGDPEGQVKGYLTQGATATNIAYPYTPYHRVIPSLYPAYLGLYNNGLNCGRWIEADFDTQFCTDRTSATGISKFCPSVTSLTYTGQKMQGYVFDSCEDNNGWCRDDAAHIDVNGSAITANYYVQWKFIKNPYYSDPNAPVWLKDIWLAWFSQASPYWSYVAILNAENGISNVQYNIGDPTNPTWIDSHVLAGDNNVTWSSTSNNGQLWQVEPVNSLTNSAPPTNPLYQLRLFDYLGYPGNQGAIYQFNLLFNDGTLGQSVSGYYMFYQGGSTVKSGSQPQNMTILSAPTGNGNITITFNSLLPGNVSLDSTQPNYLRPVLISQDGYAWDPNSCANSQCTFSNLPISSTYHLFAHAINNVSNDLTLSQVNDVAIYSNVITFPNGVNSINYALKAAEMNLSTQYAARIQIPLQFAVTNMTSINGNLQALFIPNSSKNTPNNITAQTQGCFLDTYINAMTDSVHRAGYFGNNSVCTVYYTVNNQSNFSSANPPSAFFNVILPMRVGFSPMSFSLASAYNNPVQVTGYNPASQALPTSQTVPIANYLAGNSSPSRSLYLMLDPQSDTACLQNMDPVAGVSVTVGSGTPVTLNQADLPMEIQITQPITSVTAQVNLIAGANVSCQAMPAIVPTASQSLQPGIDVVEVIKLSATPQSLPPKPPAQGIAATATGNAACMGAADTLLFSSSGTAAASVAYTTSTMVTNLGVAVPAGTYSISDNPFNVSGGSCNLSSSPTVTIQNNTYTPVTLNYSFTKTPGASCTATAQVAGSWPNGCNVVFTLNSSSPLSNVMLSWQKGAWNWNNAQVWSGEGTLNIPTSPNDNVTWALPSWVDAEGSSVGITVNNDSTPAICSAFSGGSIQVQCAGTKT